MKVETKDPVLYPKFSSQFTDEEVASNSIIVAGQKRNKVISYSEMYETSMDYNTYPTVPQDLTGRTDYKRHSLRDYGGAAGDVCALGA